jgi:outer membrane protein assembly factor BamD
MKIQFLSFYLLLSLLIACGPSKPAITYSDVAQGLFAEGMEAFNSEDYLTAMQKFRDVKAKYLYSTYAPLSELMIGDTFFAQGQYLEAIDSYNQFIQNRPNHPSVPNAHWRIALSYYQQKPKSSVILPPSYEKDRTPIEEAMRSIQQYIDRFPEGEFIPKAKEYLTDCRKDLLSYELYVARFYKRLKKYHSAQGRYEGIMSNYDDIPELWSQSMLELLDVLKAQEKFDLMKDVVQRLTLVLPNSAQAKEAQIILSQIPKKQ